MNYADGDYDNDSTHDKLKLNSKAYIHNSLEIQQNICNDEDTGLTDISQTYDYGKLSPRENNIHLFYEHKENGYHQTFSNNSDLSNIGKSTGIRNSDSDISRHISYESSLFVEVNGIQRRANSELGIRVVTKPPKSPVHNKNKKNLMNGGVVLPTEKDKIKKIDCNREIILANNLEKLKANASTYTLYSRENNERSDSLPDNIKKEDNSAFSDNDREKIKIVHLSSPRRRTQSDSHFGEEKQNVFEGDEMRKIKSMTAIEQHTFTSESRIEFNNNDYSSEIVDFNDLKKELEKLKRKLLLYEKTQGLNENQMNGFDGDDEDEGEHFGDTSTWVNKQDVKFNLDGLTNEQRANRNRVLINIGGIRHETYRSTLKNIPDTRLSWIAEESAIQSPEYDPVTGEFFFDRHPQVFSHVLNYYRTGNLHVPYDVCGPLFEEELQYWGIDDSQVESCCWLTYRQHRDAQETLKEFEGIEFEKDFDDESEPDLAKYGFAVDDSEAPPDDDLTFYQKWQPRIWNFLEDPYSSKHAKVFAYVSMSLIMLSVMLFCLETMTYFHDDTTKQVFDIMDGCCVGFFTIELILRFIFCQEKVLFLKGVMNWIDLLAIMPFFINIVIKSGFEGKSLEFIESIRVIRVFRIIKLSKHSVGLQILGHTLKASFRELLLLIFFLIIGIVIFSSLVYYCERGEDKTEFTSIPRTFWWAVITMTTVGYGDMVPITVFGKIIGGLCSISGVLMIALPVPVIVNNFNLYYSHAQARLKLPKKKRRMLCGAANALKGPAMEEFERHQEEEEGSNESIPRINMPRASINSLKSVRSNGSADNNETNLAALRMKKFGRRDSNMFSGSGSTKNGDLSPNMSSNRPNNYASNKRRSLLPTMTSLPEIEH